MLENILISKKPYPGTIKVHSYTPTDKYIYPLHFFKIFTII